MLKTISDTIGTAVQSIFYMLPRSVQMNKVWIFGVTGVFFALVIAIVALVPLAVITAVNTLVPAAAIELTLSTWFAALVLLMLFGR